MKVLFVSRSSLYSVPGGDTIQMDFTAKYLRELGVEIDFYVSEKKYNFNSYDLIHYFNITRPAVITELINKTQKPYVISSIYVDYSFYKTIKLGSKMGIATQFFGSDGIEYLKTIAKHILGKEKISLFPYLFLGQKRSIKKVLKKAKFVLPNSESEYSRLYQRFNINNAYKVIPNGVDFEKFKVNKSTERVKNQLLCVALIEPRKNQLNLIKALKNTNYKLKIIGNPAPNHISYYEECKKIAGNNIQFISRISQEELAKYYQESEIHILPSWFETTGLSSLEAAYLGCKIVVSPNGDTRDYFKQFASYCNPNSPESILYAINAASEKEYSDDLKNLILTEYNWENAAKQTFSVYSKILNK